MAEQREQWIAARAARRAALTADPDTLTDARAGLAERMADDWDEPIVFRPDDQDYG